MDIEKVMDELGLEPIRGVPTILIFKNGKEVGRWSALTRSHIFSKNLKKNI